MLKDKSVTKTTKKTKRKPLCEHLIKMDEDHELYIQIYLFIPIILFI